MITNFLLDHSALVPVAILLVALVCAALGYLFADRRRILWTLTGVSLVPVFALTLVPTVHTIDEVVCTAQFFLPTLGSVELLANIALFLPPVYFAALASRRPLTMLAAGSALSAVIEALQAFVPAIGRACDTGDWLMNTIGALLATGMAWLVGRRAQSGSSTGAISS
ncbi:VanZ family protein [Amycolatopsis roodepoortensis]|uniref:Glycopeptide antibiotics resistance protein n=1 Tax=Amycolatopsis roodepoortensis TaxID=700274 RepID=A0ABR9L0H8_9PSEU|nr:VanZ family protein [Amycolatopsis roodepoortensis]MBE1574124.1 glycopeptide antibiotics resistance protein [Amycolatopsis roodepoortensis]